MNWDPDLIVIGLTIVGVFIGTPLARALARRIERRDQLPSGSEVLVRLQSIEQALDSIAVEVERISEAQRFTTRLLAEGDAAKSESRPR
jgi:hypothetical protein